MSVYEELLKVRFKVIADFPESGLEVGEIITLVEDGIWETEDYWGKYPHLFRKLEWWEDRQLKEMPEYVKSKYSDSRRVFKVIKFDTSEKYIYYKDGIALLENYIPATKEEYEQFLMANK